MNTLPIGLVLALTATTAHAQITVPPGFAVDVLLEIETRPRLTAIRNADYGFGVIAAQIEAGTLTVLRLSQGSVDVLATQTGLGELLVRGVAFDTTGLFGNQLFLSIVSSIPSCSVDSYTEIYSVSPDGVVDQCGTRFGGAADELNFTIAFSAGAAGYTPGAYLEDANGCDGTSLWQMAGDCSATRLSQNLLPPGRVDLDIASMEFDRTGVYGSRLLLADCDANNDNQTVIYQLLPDLSWNALTEVVTTQERCYRDLSISPGGVLGQAVYVTDGVSETVTTVDAAGGHEAFASGFESILAASIDDDGDTLFVSDANGVYRIRSTGSVPGPTIVMREPRVAADDVHTGASGVAFARILFSEAVSFAAADVSITDAAAQPVPFSASGTGSQFMIVTFGRVLHNDTYAITIADTVVSTATGAPLDGDGDGEAGGDAVIEMRHRCRPDADDSGEIAFGDILEVLANWGPCE